jgi:nucleotide-binding universal stress UspA family protein
MTVYKKLLVPIDGLELSSRAQRESLALAKSLGAAVVAFVGEPVLETPLGRSAAGLVLEWRQHDERVSAHAREVLGAFEAQARGAGVPFEGHYVQTDHVDRAIAEAARQFSCDLIVMATHGRGAFGELLFGSHTKGVMARTKVPLLVLH